MISTMQIDPNDTYLEIAVMIKNTAAQTNPSCQYKQYKGLKTESLRDNMTNLELVLNMLAEATTTEISKERKPRTAAANRAVAAQGGRIAGNTRREIEAQTGKRIVSPLTAKQALAEKTAEGIEHPEADTTE